MYLHDEPQLHILFGALQKEQGAVGVGLGGVDGCPGQGGPEGRVCGGRLRRGVHHRVKAVVGAEGSGLGEVLYAFAQGRRHILGGLEYPAHPGTKTLYVLAKARLLKVHSIVRPEGRQYLYVHVRVRGYLFVPAELVGGVIGGADGPDVELPHEPPGRGLLQGPIGPSVDAVGSVGGQGLVDAEGPL